jgi:hypothetical protein
MTGESVATGCRVIHRSSGSNHTGETYTNAAFLHLKVSFPVV